MTEKEENTITPTVEWNDNDDEPEQQPPFKRQKQSLCSSTSTSPSSSSLELIGWERKGSMGALDDAIARFTKFIKQFSPTEAPPHWLVVFSLGTVAMVIPEADTEFQGYTEDTYEFPEHRLDDEKDLSAIRELTRFARDGSL